MKPKKVSKPKTVAPRTKPQPAPGGKLEKLQDDVDNLTALLTDNVLTGEDLEPRMLAWFEEHDMEPATTAKVHVHLIEPEGDVKIWSGDWREFNLDELKIQFGSGKYRTRVYVAGATNAHQRRAEKIYHVRLSPQDERRRQQLLRDATNPPQTTDGLREMMASFQATLLQALKPREENPLQTLDGIQKIAQMFKAEKPRGIADTLREARELAEFARSMAPPAPGDNNILGRGLDLLSRAIEAKTGTPPPDRAYGELPVDQAPPAISPEDEDQIMNLVVRMQLAKGIKIAQQKGDAQAWAASIYELFPEAELVKFLANQNWMETLCGIDQRCADYQVWFVLVRQYLQTWANRDGLTNAATGDLNGHNHEPAKP